jgi:flagellar FliL protein
MADVVVEKVNPNTHKRSLGKLLLLLIILMLFVAGLAFFLLSHFGISNTSGGKKAGHQQQATGTTSNETHEEELTTVRMKPFVVNLSGNRGRRLLRVVMQLEVKGTQTQKAIDEHLGQIQDRLIFHLSSKTFEDISNVQGKYQLQAEIIQHLNELLGAPLVTKTYFTEFVVQ